MSSHDYVRVEYDEKMTETDKAVLIRIDEDEFWLPWSQIEDNGNTRTFNDAFYVRRWLCEENEVPYV